MSKSFSWECSQYVLVSFLAIFQATSVLRHLEPSNQLVLQGRFHIFGVNCTGDVLGTYFLLISHRFAKCFPLKGFFPETFILQRSQPS